LGLATGSELIGRDDELARLRGLVDPPPEQSRVLVLLGDAGMGKSALLADAARQARTAGLRVLQVTGRESEQDLAFAGLHQLLRPVLDRVSRNRPLLVVADDAQWLDRGSPDALATLLAVVAEAESLEAGNLEAGNRLPLIAWNAIGRAATAAYHCGTPAGYQAVLSALDGMHEPAPPSAGLPHGYADVQRLWASVIARPFGERKKTITRLHRLVDGTEDDAGLLAPSAWVLDETELAIRLFRDALSRLRAPGVRGGSPPMLAALLWAYIDGGRWDEALATCREAGDAAAAYKLETTACSDDLGTATVLALRGDHDRIEPLLKRVLAAPNGAENGAAAARAWHAAGLAALAEGRYRTAYAQLGKLFAADGTPLHNHVSYLAIADLAAAAVRAQRQLEARMLLDRALARVDPAPGPRLEQLAGRATGLRRDHGGRAGRTRRPGFAHRAATPDRPAGRARADQRRDRGPAVPGPEHRRLAPVPLLPQAGHRRTPPAP
jgi:tetratricopeptide (TPR) repeat protein